jgi:hypothetical protein
MFERNCSLLGGDIYLGYDFHYETLPIVDHWSSITVTPPFPSDQNLLSIAALIKPNSLQSTYVETSALVTMNDGTTTILEGGRTLTPSGGLVMLTNKKTIPVRDIRSVTFMFRGSVDLAYIQIAPWVEHTGARVLPATLWMVTK